MSWSCPSDYMVGQCIGRGSFGQVFVGKHKVTNRVVAIKVLLKIDFNNEPHLLERMWQERYVLMQCSTKTNGTNHVVTLLATFHTTAACMFVMECAARGTLANVLRHVHDHPYSNSNNNNNNNNNNKTTDDRGITMEYWYDHVVPWYTRQLVHALTYLHNDDRQRNDDDDSSTIIIHADIKPSNILIMDSGQVKLCDFGSAIILKKRNRNDDDDDKDDVPVRSFLYKQQEKENEIEHEIEVEQQQQPPPPSDEYGAGEENSSYIRPPSYFRRRRSLPRGTAEYAPPELIRYCHCHCDDGNDVNDNDNNVTITPAVDLWSLACVVVEMTVGISPFYAPNEAGVIDNIMTYVDNYKQYQFHKNNRNNNNNTTTTTNTTTSNDKNQRDEEEDEEPYGATTCEDEEEILAPPLDVWNNVRLRQPRQYKSLLFEQWLHPNPIHRGTASQAIKNVPLSQHLLHNDNDKRTTTIANANACTNANDDLNTTSSSSSTMGQPKEEEEEPMIYLPPLAPWWEDAQSSTTTMRDGASHGGLAYVLE